MLIITQNELDGFIQELNATLLQARNYQFSIS